MPEGIPEGLSGAGSKLSSLKYRRVLLKVSGEFFSASSGGNSQNNHPQESIDPKQVAKLANDIAEIASLGVQVAVVLGAGNLCRGQVFAQAGFDQVAADHIGMLATVMNGLALKDVLTRKNQIKTSIRSAFDISGLVKPYVRDEAVELLESSQVVICAGGTGNPLVTTDTAAALRAIELKTDVLLKATKVDGIYSEDPMINKQAELFSELSYQQVIEQQLKVMDISAFCLVREHDIPVRVFNMDAPDVFKKIVLGDAVGTIVHSGTA